MACNVFIKKMEALGSYKTLVIIICERKRYENYEVEEDEVGGTCSTNGREEERV
jgi:hypothetical protein